MCAQRERGSQTEAGNGVERTMQAPRGSPGKDFGFYSKCEEKTLEGLGKGSDMTLFLHFNMFLLISKREGEGEERER